MLAPLATLAFLAAIWLVVTGIADILEQSGGKIAAALKGHSPLATTSSLCPVAVRVSQRARVERSLRAQPQLQVPLRAAA